MKTKWFCTGSFIREKRKLLNLSEVQIGRALGFTKQMINQIEAGSKKMTYEVFQLIIDKQKLSPKDKLRLADAISKDVIRSLRRNKK